MAIRPTTHEPFRRRVLGGFSEIVLTNAFVRRIRGMVNHALCWVAAAAIATTRLTAAPTLPRFDVGAVPLPALSLRGQADGALTEQLARRLAPSTRGVELVRSWHGLRREPAPIDRMPIARGRSIDPKMVHAPDDRYDYKLIIAPPGGDPDRTR
jgi:hypothetical protein